MELAKPHLDPLLDAHSLSHRPNNCHVWVPPLYSDRLHRRAL